MPEKVILETKELKKYFHTGAGDLHAVDNVSINILEGHTLGVVGESGCGKSSWAGRSCACMSHPRAVYCSMERTLPSDAQGT